jgi:hypothetical protein
MILREVLEEFGSLDVLIHNAGGSAAPGGGALVLSDADLAGRIRYELVRCSSIGSGLSSIDVEAGLGRDHPSFFDSA